MRKLLMTAAIGALMMAGSMDLALAQKSDGYSGLVAPSVNSSGDNRMDPQVQRGIATQPDINVAGPNNKMGRASVDEVRRERAAQQNRPARPTMAEDVPYRPLGGGEVMPRPDLGYIAKSPIAKLPDQPTQDRVPGVATTAEERRVQSEQERNARIQRLNQMREQTREERADYARDQFAAGNAVNAQETPLSQRYDYQDPNRENLVRAYKARRIQDMQDAQTRYQNSRR